jgi:hypothetical protein
VVSLRVFVPLVIPRFPLPAGIAAMIIDAVDQTIYQQFTSMNLDFYQGYDKALDVYYLSIEYISTMLNWTNLFAYKTVRFLLFYRLLGTFLFELFDVRALLLIFTNAFEYVFLAIEGVRTRWNMRRMSKHLILGITAFIWIFIKLPQEWWIHIAKLDFTDAVKNHPTLAVVAFILLGIVLFVAYRVITPKLPPADWTWRLDGRAHDLEVTPAEVETARRQLAGKFFDEELLEKVVLIGLIAGIFGQILPDFDVGTASLIIAIAAVVLINTAISELLVRRGTRYSNAFIQFAAMLAINIVSVWIARLVLGADNVDWQHTIFFLLLIALLVTLFDRYRPYNAARFLPERDLRMEGQPAG